MNAIDTFPVADLPLRVRLPNLSVGTRDALIRWGETQPGSLPWLIGRTSLYWDAMPFEAPAGLMSAENIARLDQHCMLLDATAALDLLRHRAQCGTDQAAVEHLHTPLGKGPVRNEQ